MKIRYTILTAVSLALLAGCAKNSGEAGTAETKASNDSVKATTDKTDNVWSGQVEALDKAKRVEQGLMDTAERQRQAIEMDSH
ncbi:MAG: hypothetical protein P8164_11255 [Gammaproteobacteria bacterium]|jgi:hypothetical protein